MAALTWDDQGKRFYETGVSNGVLYVMGTDGTYGNGVAWNGLTGVTESPSGAELSDLWADDIKYASLRSAEEFGATIEAYTYPDEWAECDGSAEPVSGLYLGQQGRKSFGFVFKSKIGSDTLDANSTGDDKAYKLHLIYNATANVSERAYASINDSPDAITFSWEIKTTPVEVEGYKPTSHIVIDSRKFTATAAKAKLTALETTLFGGTNTQPTLPSPDDVIDALTTTTSGGGGEST